MLQISQLVYHPRLLAGPVMVLALWEGQRGGGGNEHL